MPGGWGSWMPPRVLPKSFNWKAVRIVGSLRNPDQPPEDLLDSVSFRQADGQEALLQEFPIAELLSVGETVQAEEFVLQIPDGRSATVVPNATPIICSQGAAWSPVVVDPQGMADVEERSGSGPTSWPWSDTRSQRPLRLLWVPPPLCWTPPP